MAKPLPKINDIKKTPVKEVLGKDGAPKKRRGRPKKMKTLEEVQADIDARNPTFISPETGGRLPVKKTRAKISPAKFYALDAGLKLEEENKIQAEKITKIITITNFLLFFKNSESTTPILANKLKTTGS